MASSIEPEKSSRRAISTEACSQLFNNTMSGGTTGVPFSEKEKFERLRSGMYRPFESKTQTVV